MRRVTIYIHDNGILRLLQDKKEPLYFYSVRECIIFANNTMPNTVCEYVPVPCGTALQMPECPEPKRPERGQND